MESLAYLARQPILDREGKIFAYELLFRDSPTSDTAVIASDLLATAQVLENVLNSIGIQNIVGTRKAFVNCSRNMLLNSMFKLLNPKYFVLEVLEDVEVDGDVVEAIQKYKAQGFEIALDDFVFNSQFIERFQPLFSYVSYIKMDVVENTPEDMEKAAAYFKAKNILMLAEKVEDEETFKRCAAAGYDFFQGFYFARPELVTGEKIDATSSAIWRLLKLLRERTTFDEFCNVLENSPEVAANLLKFVNADSQTHCHVNNVKDAVAWVGMRHMQEWLMLMLYARRPQKPQR